MAEEIASAELRKIKSRLADREGLVRIMFGADRSDALSLDDCRAIVDCLVEWITGRTLFYVKDCSEKFGSPWYHVIGPQGYITQTADREWAENRCKELAADPERKDAQP